MNERIEFLEQLLDHLQAIAWQQLPPEVRERAVVFMADTVGVGLSAARLPDTQRLRSLAQAWGPGKCEPLGGGVRLSAPEAAFVNGFQIHCQEFDAVHEQAVVHAMSVVSGALLSDCQRSPVSGSKLLEAVVAGVEVAAGLGIASRTPMRFFRPATAGLMGAVLALAKVHDADRTTLKNALGLAYSHVSGNMQAHLEGSPALAYQIGIAARNAVLAWDMASAGCSGPHDVLEGPFGFLNLIEGQWDLQPSAERLGRVWAIAELAHKPYPSGRASHGILRLLEDILTEQNLDPQDVQALTAFVPPLIKRLVGRSWETGLSLAQARLCLPFLVGTRLLKGPIDLHSYDEGWYTGEAWHEAAAKLRIAEDGNDDPNALVPQRLQVQTRDGRLLEKATVEVYGSPSAPLSAEAQFQKFSGCLDFGGIAGPSDRRSQWEQLFTFPEAASAHDLLRAFHSSEG